MRRSLISVSVSAALTPGHIYQKGPVSPYTSDLNRQIYYNWFGIGPATTIRGRSVGKTYLLKGYGTC